MRLSFLSRSLALVCLSAICSAGNALAGTDAEDRAFDREVRPVEKTGCKEYWSSDNARSIERVIKACTRALERTSWSDVQRGYAYHVRGAASAVADKLPEALSDLDQAITINPSYAPSYYERGYVHMRLEHPALSHADFQKSVDLGNKEAEYPLKIARDTCPSLIWEGKTCASAGAPVPPALAAKAPAQPTTGPAIEDPPRLIVADAPTTTAVKINGEDYDLVSYSCPASAARPLVTPPGCTSTENRERNETEYLCDKPMLGVFADCFVTHAPVGKSKTTSTAAAAVPQAEPASPAEKSGWFSWLWGGKKPAAEPAPPVSSVTAASPPVPKEPTPTPTPGPTTTVQYAGKDIVLEAPPGTCFVSPDNEIVTLFFTKIAQPTREGQWRILAGYKDCDAPLNDFRTQLGAYAVREDVIYDSPEREAAIRDAPYKMCESIGARPDIAIETLDAALVAKLNEGAQQAIADPENFVMKAVPIGMHASLCTTVRPWALNRAKPPYMLFTGIFPLKSRLIFLTASPAYLGPQSPQEIYTRLHEMVGRMTTANYEQ